MNTAVINVKLNPDLKVQAQNVAQELGLSLSSLVNACLKQVVRARTVTLRAAEVPTDYMIKTLDKSKKDKREGKIISFKNNDEVLDYIDTLITNDKKSRKNWFFKKLWQTAKESTGQNQNCFPEAIKSFSPVSTSPVAE